MAYSTHTPTAAKFADVDLPDDSELESSGIGAVNTPMEDLADGLLWATEIADLTYASTAAYTTFFTVDSATMTAYTDVTGLDIDVAANVGDRIHVTLSFVVQTLTGTGCYLDVYTDAGAGSVVPGTEHCFTSAIAINIPVTLSFVVQAGSTATINFQVRAKCATNTWLIYGPVTQTALRVSRV